MVRGGPEVRFEEGSTRVPRGFHEGSTRFCEGCEASAKKSTACCWGYHLRLYMGMCCLVSICTNPRRASKTETRAHTDTPISSQQAVARPSFEVGPLRGSAGLRPQLPAPRREGLTPLQWVCLFLHPGVFCVCFILKNLVFWGAKKPFRNSSPELHTSPKLVSADVGEESEFF